MNTYHVLSPAHVTFYKYAVQAESLEDAKAIFETDGDAADEVEYLGFIDGDWSDGPEPDWSDPDNSYTEGTG